VAAHRDEIRDVITRHRCRAASRIRLGGPWRGSRRIGPGPARPRAHAGFSLLDQAAIIRELTEFLGVQVDVITEGALDVEAARQINAEAVPL
jgi:hypothetical protein